MHLTFIPGVSSLQVTVPVVDDTLLEIDETFFGNLRLPEDRGSIVFQPGRAIATLVDNDCGK